MTDSPETAKIAVSAATYWVDRPYDYRIPDALRDKIAPGVRVVVPFGGGNRRTEGIVLSLGAAQPDVRLKNIASVLDAEPVLSPEMIRLAVWLRERYFCTVYDAVHAMLPAGLWYQMESVYTLLDIDRGVPEVWGSKYDVRELLRACYYAIDKKPLSEAELNFGERELMKIVLKKIRGTDVELLLKESGLIE